MPAPDHVDLHELFAAAADHAATFRASLPTRPVAAPDPRGAARAFAGPLPRTGEQPAQVLRALIEAAEPGVVASAGPRYFGFVTGGALPAATAADIVAAGWDQFGFNHVASPAAGGAEAAAGTWVKDLLGIPQGASVGFVTGAQAANTVGLAAARHHVLREAGWDVERLGLNGAPAVRVVAGAERHATIDRSLRLLGFGTACVQEVRATPDGAIDVNDLAGVLSTGAGPTIVCLQTGNVNTGACDDLRAAIPLTHEHGGWAHVDGAFGLWAAANPRTRPLTDGVELADSWGCDAHKWLNVPYDSAFAFCSRPEVHQAAMSISAAYLAGTGTPAMAELTAESSRRARGFAVWAALRELGRDGVAELVERTCRLSARFAERLVAGGGELGAPVVLNQALVRFGSDAHTDALAAAVQAEGTCWVGGTTWRERRWLRLSVSNHLTTEVDIDAAADAVMRVERSLR